jgi:hypothetical protein
LPSAGKIVTVTRWWVPDIPRNGRAFFQVTVPDAPAYRIIVEVLQLGQDVIASSATPASHVAVEP